ncbi:tyrosyl-DNA phosphodiesterase 2 [Brachypodium distachyon]|uniref:Endonuclease/exonuclease/phosphatase domain-containing protein n=2 Tax=Brachypodium distachyon TaxID=15368 RepID=I1HEU2_BRADI|nr:tyrosyl-DNA phosphodiesterase 2 [Brachypodium distachyon]KQK04076.1 hypothetical protein BRADI_2g11520v3 [Brachypodium distachyon]PNT70415.1 hypothetical protein BRADI_2g11520v3 [Brachypodium distachyon]|eukprot:XP_003565702.1 tyrosyl-DNA phosphodiesterase 2 [Brachypodium distachyon]
MATLLSLSPRLFLRRLLPSKTLFLPRTFTVISPAMTSPSPPHFPVRIPPLELGASGSSASSQCHSALCTLSNLGSSDSCDAGLAAVAGASFLPLHRCSRKRGRSASPDVIQVCADEGVGSKEGHKAPAQKGDSGTHADRKTIKIMTYNVWFREDLELQRRMYALGNLIQHHSPDLICLQEVTPDIYLLLQNSDWWREYKCSLSREMAMERAYYCLQMSKLPVASFDCIPFSNSIMGRELCIADVNDGGVTMVLATSHLESPCPGPPRWDQMYSNERVAQAKESLKILGVHRNVIFCGDMNWDDKGDGPFPLPEGWVDAWAELKPGEDGWTYDTKANAMLSGNSKLQKRLDRFVCKLADFKVDSIAMIGKEAIPGISYLKVKKVRGVVRELELPVLPSDHFGLLLEITHQAGSTSSE